MAINSLSEYEILTLINEYSWNWEQILLAVRSKGKCEYCDKNLFESIDNYKLWQVDHIIPKSAIIENFDPENFNNKSISCWQCNVSFKGKYNPITVLGIGKSREAYIENIRNYIANSRTKG